MCAVIVGDSERFCWTEVSVSVSVGTSALTPMEPNVRQVVVRVSAHVGTRVCPCGNHITSIGLSSLMQVTPSLVRLTEAIVVQPTKVLASVEERTPGSWGWGLGLALGTPERLPSDRPHTDSNGVLSWLGLGLGVGVCKPKPRPDIPLPTKRSKAEQSGAVRFLPP